MQVDARAPELVVEDFVQMMNATRMCVLIHDASTKNILWANPAACELLEFTLEEIRPLKANDMSSSAQQYDRVIGRAWLQEAVEKGAARIEWHYRNKSGRIIPTDALAIRVELDHGPAVMVQFRDIGREQEVERELRRTTSYVDALARHTSALALMMDAAGHLRFATDSLLLTVGAPLNAPLDHLYESALLRINGQRVTWGEAAARAEPLVRVQLEVPRAGSAGSTWLEGTLERLRDDEGLLLLLHDSTEQVAQAEQRARELQQENYLARYNAMGDMAMAIAHELGQPLAAAQNFLTGIGSHVESAKVHDGLRREVSEQLSFGLASSLRQVERASAIVSALRRFVARLEQVEQVVDLNGIVEECLYFVRLRASAASVEVDVHLAAAPVEVRCERVLTGQALVNLCFNAIDEMRHAPMSHRRLTVTTSIDGADGVCTVDDEGRGLTHDPFAQAFTSKDGGSGIGLALSYRIITRQHGRIWASSRPEGGSRFGIRLPLAKGA